MEYEEYAAQLDELPPEPPLLRAMTYQRICAEADAPQQQTEKALQILEILLKYGATAELHEVDLPKHEPTRAATLHLLKKYNLAVPGAAEIINSGHKGAEMRRASAHMCAFWA